MNLIATKMWNKHYDNFKQLIVTTDDIRIDIYEDEISVDPNNSPKLFQGSYKICYVR